MNHTLVKYPCKTFIVAIALGIAGLLSAAAGTPKTGEMAPNFTLKTLDAKPVELNQLTAKGRVVLVVLRGWPGYQCPICERQVRDLMNSAKQLKATGVQMLFVYPGPAEQLKAHAQEFLKNKDWPSDWQLVIDPNCTFTKAYGLRWEAPNETAYPSTFILDREGKVQFSHVSKGHGDRVGAKDLLSHL